MCLIVILFSKLRVYCSKEMDMPIFLICSTLFGTGVRLPTYQPDLPLWDPHPFQYSHSHFSWDCSLGLLHVYESNCHTYPSVLPVSSLLTTVRACVRAYGDECGCECARVCVYGCVWGGGGVCVRVRVCRIHCLLLLENLCSIDHLVLFHILPQQ